MKQRINVHMYPSPITHETRILRITKSLAAEGLFTHVYIVGALREKGLPEHEALDEVRRVWRVPTTTPRRGLIGKVLNMLEWSIRVLWFLRKQPVDCINARSLSTLPTGVVLKLLKGSRLIYDVHEIETETGEVTGMRRALSKAAERFFVGFADAVNVTSNGHGAWYQREYKIPRVWVVRNYPYRRSNTIPKQSILKTTFNIAPDQLLFIYQGAVARQRGTHLLMRVFARIPDRHIVFMGFGEDVEEVREYERRYPNIHYHPAVPPNQVVNYTSGADVGLHMMDDSCVNHLYALPNKPMEYMNAGIPAIVSDLPEMGALIRNAGAGWVIPVNHEHDLEKLVRNLTREDIAEKAAAALAWARTHTWEGEQETLRELYRTLNFAPHPSPECYTHA